MGFERKFKDGDKVKVIDSNSSSYKKIGIIKWYGYPLCLKDPFYKKKIYYVEFKTYSREFHSYQLEKVEKSNNINTKSNKLSISDLKSGMKVRIKPDLKEGKSTVVYVTNDMKNFAGTINIIKNINLNTISYQYQCIYLENIPYTWDIDCFSEIIEESKEKMNISENIELPLKEGQIVTLLDGKKYQVVKNNTNKFACSFCSLNQTKCGKDRCNITHINGKISCSFVIPPHHYFKLSEDQQTEDNSSKSLTISNFKIGMKIKVKKDFDKIVPTSTLDLFHFYHIPIIMKSFEEKELIVENVGNCFIKAKNFQWYPEWLEIIEESQIFCENESALTKVSEETGIITKVTFTLNEFKSEKLEHSKFTIL